LDDMNLDLAVISRFRFANQELYRLRLPRVLFLLHTGVKAESNPQILKEQFHLFLSGELDSTHPLPLILYR
jgi:hypothetical protein